MTKCSISDVDGSAMTAMKVVMDDGTSNGSIWQWQWAVAIMTNLFVDCWDGSKCCYIFILWHTLGCATLGIAKTWLGKRFVIVEMAALVREAKNSRWHIWWFWSLPSSSLDIFPGTSAFIGVGMFLIDGKPWITRLYFGHHLGVRWQMVVRESWWVFLYHRMREEDMVGHFPM